MVEGRTLEQLVGMSPINIPKSQWIDLVNRWFHPNHEKFSRIGTNARAQVKTPRTTGSMSFSRKKHKFQVEHARPPRPIECYTSTHKHKDGTFVTPIAQDIVEKANSLITENHIAERNSIPESAEQSLFIEILGGKRNGHVQGYGLGVTSTMISDIHDNILINERFTNNAKIQKL
ncbi:hypothetical protein AXF42_Ash020310 [Apostasia shenzhenica]|uniref:Uncharacterized protein n=1 Tax=Apostasia shenzhenica TaxID=1088818 RepID=A0A2H9ZT04_9ASPA|nr:hypothetical protein AXF42_Ash020310 [Apostasia shenzhenica]